MDTLNKYLEKIPRGTKLYSTVFGEVEFLYFDDRSIWCRVSGKDVAFSLDGRYMHYPGECVLFPSKGNKFWELHIFPNTPKFKQGDVIVHKDDACHLIEIHSVDKDHYNTQFGHLYFDFQDAYMLYKGSPKYNIDDLKPFDKVLTRNSDESSWECQFFERYQITSSGVWYICINDCYNQCVPYKDNEHLLGTIDPCIDYYKTW